MKSLRLMLLLSSALVTGCVQVPHNIGWCIGCPEKPPSNATVYVEDTWAFPFFAFDVGSVYLKIIEIDGYPAPSVVSASVPSGRHKVVVRAIQGPTGPLGPSELLALCKGTVSLDASPGASYKIRFGSVQGRNVLQMVSMSDASIIHEAPCVPDS